MGASPRAAEAPQRVSSAPARRATALFRVTSYRDPRYFGPKLAAPESQSHRPRFPKLLFLQHFSKICDFATAWQHLHRRLPLRQFFLAGAGSLASYEYSPIFAKVESCD